MTDLNTNRYLYTQMQPTYGDNNLISQPVKKNITTNPIGKVVDNVVDGAEEVQKEEEKSFSKRFHIPIVFAIGSALSVAVNKLCKVMVGGKNFEDSWLGKVVGKIDGFSKKPDSAKKVKTSNTFLGKIKNIGFIKQLREGASKVLPKWGMVKDMVASPKNMVLKELLEEAATLSGKDPKVFEALTNALQSGTKDAATHKKALEAALSSVKGKELSSNFINLKNRAQGLMGSKSHSLLSRGLIRFHNAVSRVFHIASFKGGMKAKAMSAGFFLMNSYFMGEMVKKTIDAPKGEKGSTAAHGLFVEFVAGWLLFEPMMRAMYKTIGALQNLKGGNWFSKAVKAPLRWTGNLLGIGLKESAPLAKATTTGGKFKNFFIKAGRFTKGGAGAVGRFGLLMFGLFPIMDKAARFVVHNIFGKPKTLLAEEEKAEKGEEENKPQLPNYIESQNKPMLTVAHAMDSSGNKNDMIQKYLQMHAAQNGMNLAQTPIAGAELKNSNNIMAAQKIDKPKYGYIPSDEKEPASKADNEKRQKFINTIDKTDRVIDEAKRVLG